MADHTVRPLCECLACAYVVLEVAELADTVKPSWNSVMVEVSTVEPIAMLLLIGLSVSIYEHSFHRVLPFVSAWVLPFDSIPIVTEKLLLTVPVGIVRRYPYVRQHWVYHAQVVLVRCTRIHMRPKRVSVCDELRPWGVTGMNHHPPR